MLDDRITRFVSDTMRIRAREFDEDLAMRLSSIDTQAIKNGALESSGRIVTYAQVCCYDLRSRAQYLFIEIQRALGLYPQTLDDTLKSGLIGLLITEVRSQATRLQNLLKQRLGERPGPLAPHLGAAYSRLNDECEHLNGKYTLEIGAFMQASQQTKSRAGANDGSVIVNGTVGVLQMGASSSATLTINVGPDDREAMLKSLELAASTVKDAIQLGDEQRRQMLELIEQAGIAARQPRPNTALLHGMFTVLCQTIQTLGSSAPAIAALRVAALPFGIVL